MLTFWRTHTMGLRTTIEGLNKMQTIAIAFLGFAALNCVFLMSVLWRMSSTGQRPAWVARLLG